MTCLSVTTLGAIRRYTGRKFRSVPRPSPGVCRLMSPLAPDHPIALPAGFFTDILPAIMDLSELRVTLSMYYRVTAGPPLVAEADLLADPALRRGLVPLGSVRDPAGEIQRGLELALTRGTLLAVEPVDPTDERRWYTINTPEGRELVHNLETGKQTLARVTGAPDITPPVVAVQPNVFRLYERHIAVLTPLVAQQLAEAAEQYPPMWIADAFDEAIARDRRSWRFIRHLLERWASEGREHATDRRLAARPLDPAKYTKGKYAAIFRR